MTSKSVDEHLNLAQLDAFQQSLDARILETADALQHLQENVEKLGRKYLSQQEKDTSSTPCYSDMEEGDLPLKKRPYRPETGYTDNALPLKKRRL